MTNGQPPTKASPPILTIVGGVQTVQVAGTDANASYFVGQRHTADMFTGPASKPSARSSCRPLLASH